MKSLLLDAVRLSAAATALWVLFACPALADPPRYTIKDIFPIEEDSGVRAFGDQINNAGQVVVSTIFSEDDFRRFLYDDRDGSTTLLPIFFLPTDMNERGTVIGYDEEGLSAFVYRDGVLTIVVPFEVLPYDLSFTGGINDADEVAGYLDPLANDVAPGLHAFLSADGTVRLLDLSVDQGSCTGSEALDINNSRQIVGRIRMPPNCEFEAFLHENGETLVLGKALSDERTEAIAINEAGQVLVQVTGPFVIGQPTPRSAYLYSHGSLQRIGDDTTTVSRLNNLGWVVGSTGGHAFLYIDGELHDLNDLVTDLTEWERLLVARDINDSGQITGAGVRRADPPDLTSNAFLMTPLTAQVQIDIKPGDEKNRINLRSKGLIGVAVLSTNEFDATQVDWETVTFGPQEATEFHQRSHLRDVDEDGDMDYVAHFKIRETGIRCRDTQATLSGETFDGVPFTVTGNIKVVKCR